MNFKVGDRVIDGWGVMGIVVEICDDIIYPVLVQFDNQTRGPISHTLDGRLTYDATFDDIDTIRKLTPLELALK